ncbi:MAG: transcriptional regulator [Pseudomonadota bacterium]
MISSDQIRGARALLRLSQAELAEAAEVSLETIKRLELMEGELKTRLDTLTKIKAALEKSGVEFIPENGGGAGVRLKKKGTKR